jgi:hypothetical protein
MDVLDLIRTICKRPSTNGDDDAPYSSIDIAIMRKLQQNLQGAVGEYGTFYDRIGVSFTRQEMLTYLYRCAALIYLNRAVAGLNMASFQHERLVREGLLLLKNLGSCESAWPLFVLACEANQDEQRLQILEILSATRRESLCRSNHVPLIQRMVEAIWNQNDLDIDCGVKYVRTLHAIISSAPSLPLFA